MINDSELEARGYRKYQTAGRKMFFAPHFWSRWITDPEGRPRYTVELQRWSFPDEWCEQPWFPGNKEGPTWSAKATMYEAGGRVIRINLDPMLPTETLESVEAFYAGVHAKLGLVPDPHNG